MSKPVAPQKLTTLDQQACWDAFPAQRINATRWHWWSYLWLLYVPFGIVIATTGMVCTAILFTFFEVSGRLDAVRPHHLFPLWSFRIQDQNGKELSEADLKTPSMSIMYCAEHHHTFLDAAFLFPSQSSVICTDRLSHGFFARYVKPFCFFKKRGTPLHNLLLAWKHYNQPRNLLIYPQGVTSSPNTLIDFQAPALTFAALYPQTIQVRPVVTEYNHPFPINERTVKSSFFVDAIFIFATLFGSVTFTVLDPLVLTDDGSDQIDVAHQLSNAIMKYCGDKRKRYPLTYREKGAWQELVLSCLHIQYRKAEVAILGCIQRIPGLSYPSLLLHYILQESTLILIGSVLYLTRWQQRTLLVVIRAAVTDFTLIVLIKLFYGIPRPVWVASDRLHRNPYQLKNPLRQYDYTFPSGHAALLTSVYISYYFASHNQSTHFHFPLYMHFVLGFLAFFTGLSRLYLALHWPTDVLAGWALGALWGYIWASHLDVRFYQASSTLQFGISTTLCILFLGCAIMLNNTSSSRKHIKLWSARVQHPLKCTKSHTFLLPLGMLWVSLVGQPILSWFSQAGVHSRYCLFTSIPAWLRFVEVLVGVAIAAFVYILMLILPSKVMQKGQDKDDTEKNIGGQNLHLYELNHTKHSALTDPKRGVEMADISIASSAETKTKLAEPMAVSPMPSRRKSVLRQIFKDAWYLLSVTVVLLLLIVFSQLLGGQIEKAHCGVAQLNAALQAGQIL